MSRSIVSLASLLSLVVFESSALAGVRIVGTGAGDDPTIQAAVDAAQSGDLVLIRPGTYAGFTIDGKGITVACHALGAVTIQGTVEVKNVAAGDTAVLTTLSTTGLVNFNAGLPALKLTDNAGAVRVENSIWKGGNGLIIQSGAETYGPGGHAVILSNSLDVAIAGCTLQGGNGGGESNACNECTGGIGGDALDTDTTAVALYDCTLTGGKGGNAGYAGGHGGNATVIVSWGIFASNCTFRGGDGGMGWDFLQSYGGLGGGGLLISQNTGARVLDDAYFGGAGGACPVFPTHAGAPGPAVVAFGAKIDVDGVARTFHTSALTDSAQPISITVNGQPGDHVYVVGNARLGFQFKWGFHGVWLLGFPLPIALDPLGTIPASGTLTVQMQLADLPAGADVSRLFLQGLVSDAHGNHWYLGAAMSVSRLSCARLVPDCDGDGSFDYCELMAGTLVDCDHNGVPDACEPDCNGNGIADACDIAAHTSADINGNGIPDECESSPGVFYVDASAAAGGDGSSAHPFQSLGQAFSSALGNETINIRDGVYTGPANRNLRFNGRNLVVRSVNGPNACILDLQNQLGRAFEIRDGETSAARVQGLTIKNGSLPSPVSGTNAGAGILVLSASPTIEHCVFDHCVASGSGGGMWLTSSVSLITGCVFNNNGGSGVYCQAGAPRIEYCVFTDNQSNGVHFSGGVAPGGIVTHSILHHNGGGAGGAVDVAGTATIDDCLITENHGTHGGGVGCAFGSMNVSNCTIANNSTQYISDFAGGGIDYYGGSGSVSNCILFGNQSPHGDQLALSYFGASVTVTACDVSGGQAGVYLANGTTLTWGSGNIDADPLFVDPNGPDGDPLTYADNDFRLAITSPCIDAGNNALVASDWADLDNDGNTIEPVPYDLDGVARFADVPSVPDTGSGTAPIVDMGCYEHRP